MSGRRTFLFARWTQTKLRSLRKRTDRKKGVPRVIIAAWLREWSQMKSTIRLNAETTSLPLNRGRSLLQGDPMAPSIVVAGMDVLLERFVEVCNWKGLGFRGQDLRIPVLAFADNVWLLAKTPSELENMFRLLTVMMGSGRHTKTDGCTWTSTHEFPGRGSSEPTARRASKLSEPKISMIREDKAELNFRLLKAWQAFHEHKYIVCQKNSNVKKKSSCSWNASLPPESSGERGRGFYANKMSRNCRLAKTLSTG